MTYKIRPWGLLSDMLPRLPASSWDLFGCISPEDRCLSTHSILHAQSRISSERFIAVKDPDSKFTAVAEQKIDERYRDFISSGGQRKSCCDLGLFEIPGNIVDVVKSFVKSSSGDVILDISSFPKRFFFIIMRILLESRDVKNLVVTYTRPEKYSNGPLSENPESWRSMPLFGGPYPANKLDVIVIGIGFEPLGLFELQEQYYQSAEVKLLMAFPPGPPAFQRSWEFIRNLEKKIPHNDLQPIGIDSRDVSSAFNHICSITDYGRKWAEFAPYGPKTMSLAMCIYSCLMKTAIYYTQPSVYNPNYTSGVFRINNIPQNFAYCIRINGIDIYDV